MTVTLRRATVDDAAAFARTMGDPLVYPNLMQLPYADGRRGAPDWPTCTSPAGPTCCWSPSRRSTAGARSSAARACTRCRRCPGSATSPCSASRSSRGPGARGCRHGADAGLCDCADRWMQVLRLQLEVYVDNEPAIALYRKFGFVDETTQRAYAMRDGAFADSLGMARLHPRPPAIAASAAHTAARWRRRRSSAAWPAAPGRSAPDAAHDAGRGRSARNASRRRRGPAVRAGGARGVGARTAGAAGARSGLRRRRRGTRGRLCGSVRGRHAAPAPRRWPDALRRS